MSGSNGRESEAGPAMNGSARRRTFDEIRGASPRMQEAVEIARRFAWSDLPVLLTGETGTGKEVLARAIHYGGSRAGGPFIAVNCSAIPHDLFESQFFGHARGAYTGADSSHPGFFDQANGGTIFLDEFNSLELYAQPKLLR